MGALGQRVIEGSDGEGELDRFADGAEFAAEACGGDIAWLDGTFLAQAFHGSAAEDGSGAGGLRFAVGLAEAGFEPDESGVRFDAGIEEFGGAEEDDRAVVPGEPGAAAEGGGDGAFRVCR